MLRDVTVPQQARTDSEGSFLPPGEETYPAMVFMAWPNGAPCIEMDMYLADLCKSLRADHSGGSVRQEAVKLSHLVRFCWSARINFWDLTSLTYADFLQKLGDETGSSGPGKKRESNQVRQISYSGIRFLTWLQNTLLPHRHIVGLEHQPHQILLVEEKLNYGKKGGRTYHAFSQNPPPSTPQAKVPMPDALVSRLWTAVDASSNEDLLAAQDGATSSLSYIQKTRLTHLRHRRLLMLQLMLATGARPSEIAEMRLDANLEAIKHKRLTLSTGKREPGARRSIRTTMAVAIRIQAYAKVYRADLCRALREKGENPEPEDRLFLNNDGKPLSKESMTRDFERLCIKAGIAQRACLSMFRHRAITTLVALHIKDFYSSTSTTPLHAINLGDYTTILAQVAEITGHKRPESLKPYVHLAWKELGAFDSIGAAADVVTMLQTFIPELRSYITQCDLTSVRRQKQRMSEVLEWMQLMEKEMSERLETFRFVKADPEGLRAVLP